MSGNRGSLDSTPPFDDELDDGLHDEDEGEDYDCGEDADGECSLAGTEECDFECPYRDSMIARLNRKHREDAGQQRLKENR